jgi:hypothetical protein
MFSTKAFVLAALAAVAYAAPKPCSPTPTLPLTGGATELPAPPSGLVLKRIAVGHGIQNYSCSAAPTATPDAKGALAVLYDVTSLYPGTPHTGLSTLSKFNALTTTILHTLNIPLNFLNPDAAIPGVVLSSKLINTTPSPFTAPADITLGTQKIKFLGRHYFDNSGTPTFDLSEAGLKANVVKLAGAPVPVGADAGTLGTGAVAWLQLGDSGKGLSVGLNQVYRVITAGGVAEACSVTGESVTSVPYTAFYWFYG